jgi:hypothetical protein
MCATRGSAYPLPSTGFPLRRAVFRAIRERARSCGVGGPPKEDSIMIGGGKIYIKKRKKKVKIIESNFSQFLMLHSLLM